MPAIQSHLPLLLAFAASPLLCILSAQAATPSQQRPKLVLIIPIDQLRADQIPRFEKRFLPPHSGVMEVGGFRYLME